MVGKGVKYSSLIGLYNDYFVIILGLGSNIGDRLGYLNAAVGLLSCVLTHMQYSRILESEAILPQDATPDMNRPFYNMAILGICSLAPEALLDELKRIEHEVGRQQRCKWGPREIDIDILAVDGMMLESPKLNIPHKELLNRDFALIPLADVAPDWRYPLGGIYNNQTALEIIAEKGYGLCDILRETGLSIHG